MAKQNRINALQQQFQQKADTRNYGIMGTFLVNALSVVHNRTVFERDDII
jgi:hypothetical protein